MADLSFLCDVSRADEFFVGASIAFFAAVGGAGARVFLALIWRGRPIDPMSLSGFGVGCLTPFGLTIALAVAVAEIVPGVEECASTDVIGYPLMALLVSPLAIYIAFFVTSKLSRAK